MKEILTNAIQIPVREFAKKNVCDGHLYLTSKEGRRFYLMKPGVFIDPAFVKKHATQNTTFDFQSVVNDEVRARFTTLLKELRYLQFEKDLQLKAVELMTFFESSFSRGEHFLSFALACHEVFHDLPVQFSAKMHETDLYLFRKALYSGAFAVIAGIANDFYNPLLLKDFFNVTFLLDIGLCGPDYSYYVSQACNHENHGPGSGREWLVQQKATADEMKVFISHPERSYQLMKQNRELWAHPELVEIALYQHELADGRGFPRGVPKGLISSWESVVILADSLVDIQDEYGFETNVLDHVFNFKSEKMNDLPVGRVYKRFCQSLKYFRETGRTGS